MSVCLVVVVEVLGCFVKEVWIEERIIDCENRLLFDLRKREWENVEISRKNLLESRLADREVCPVIADMSFPLVGFCRPWIVFCNCLRTNSLVHRAGWKLDYRRENQWIMSTNWTKEFTLNNSSCDCLILRIDDILPELN